ncbi:hypothetical protein [Rubrimonas cliftonensis]|uniref:Uncharacterized protein n=1 Tax=Rubrimonas cliftonensis TaxID=89524 RepID=A0A1H4BB68_9RHOB|nr:hypothetical protein [Rubrimonas cliftonensis]SEA45389.1 hypothetical protein SAMN05444370_105114 [Rubrimonas cliftonensis]
MTKELAAARTPCPAGAVAAPPCREPGEGLAETQALRPCRRACAEPELRCPLRDLLRCF